MRQGIARDVNVGTNPEMSHAVFMVSFKAVVICVSHFTSEVVMMSGWERFFSKMGFQKVESIDLWVGYSPCGWSLATVQTTNVTFLNLGSRSRRSVGCER